MERFSGVNEADRSALRSWRMGRRADQSPVVRRETPAGGAPRCNLIYNTHRLLIAHAWASPHRKRAPFPVSCCIYSRRFQLTLTDLQQDQGRKENARKSLQGTAGLIKNSVSQKFTRSMFHNSTCLMTRCSVPDHERWQRTEQYFKPRA